MFLSIKANDVEAILITQAQRLDWSALLTETQKRNNDLWGAWSSERLIAVLLNEGISPIEITTNKKDGYADILIRYTVYMSTSYHHRQVIPEHALFQSLREHDLPLEIIKEIAKKFDDAPMIDSAFIWLPKLLEAGFNYSESIDIIQEYHPKGAIFSLTGDSTEEVLRLIKEKKAALEEKRHELIDELEKSYYGKYSQIFFKALVANLFSKTIHTHFSLALRNLYLERLKQVNLQFKADVLQAQLTRDEKSSIKDSSRTLKEIRTERIRQMEILLREHQRTFIYSIVPEVITKGWTKANFEKKVRQMLLDNYNNSSLAELGNTGLKKLIQDFHKLAEAIGLI